MNSTANSYKAGACHSIHTSTTLRASRSAGQLAGPRDTHSRKPAPWFSSNFSRSSRDRFLAASIPTSHRSLSHLIVVASQTSKQLCRRLFNIDGFRKTLNPPTAKNLTWTKFALRLRSFLSSFAAERSSWRSSALRRLSSAISSCNKA